MAQFKIPLPDLPASFNVALPSGLYRFRLHYNEAGDGQWILDIQKDETTPLIMGMGITAGADILGQYEHLGIGVKLYILTPGEPDYEPKFADLGTRTLLVYEPLDG